MRRRRVFHLRAQGLKNREVPAKLAIAERIVYRILALGEPEPAPKPRTPRRKPHPQRPETLFSPASAAASPPLAREPQLGRQKRPISAER